jgi:hypothetical protein
MRVLIPILLAIPLAAQEKIAVIGLVHSHVWGHLGKMVKGQPAKLVGIAETKEDLIAEAKKAGWEGPYYSDYKKMLGKRSPTSFGHSRRMMSICRLSRRARL